MNTFSLLAAVALLAGNAFFVGAEFSLISARRDRLEPLVAAGDRRARVVSAAIEHLSDMLAAAQLGITVCSLALGALAEPAVAHLLEGPLGALGVSGAARHAVAVALALTIVVSLHIVLGEMVPKNLALVGPERSALWLGPPLVAFARATRPLIWLLNVTANRLLRMIGVTPADELATAYTPEELHAMIAESRREGLLPDTEHELLTSALGLAGHDARSVMIPIQDVVTVSWNITAEELERLVAETGFSRFPVRSPASPTFSSASSASSSASSVSRSSAAPGSRASPASAYTASPSVPGMTPSSPVSSETTETTASRSSVSAASAASSAAPITPVSAISRASRASRADTRRPGREPPQPRIAGYVHAKDVLGLPPGDRAKPLPARRLRPMVALNAEEPLDEVLRTMQAVGSQLALVVGPGAQALGVVALEDVLEELVGKIEDATHP